MSEVLTTCVSRFTSVPHDFDYALNMSGGKNYNLPRTTEIYLRILLSLGFPLKSHMMLFANSP